MYAIIEACGRQYKVETGEQVFFEKLEVEEGKKVNFDKVVLVSDNGKVQVGTPYVDGIKVEGKVVSHGRAKKVLVYKYKAKKNERRTIGHRQDYTKVEITSIGSGKAAAPKTEAKAAPKAEKPAEKAEVKPAEKTTPKTTAKKAEAKKGE